MTIGESTAPAGTGGRENMTIGSRADISPVSESKQDRALNPKSKRAAVLRVFLERGARGLNCFEAVTLAHDYVLRTTVSECRSFHGIEFAKRYETVPGHNGSRIDCVRYSLTANGTARVRELLGEAAQ